eukprot:m.92679 g.92679  ORF g.92679 m.92679 type:complete len:519 (-) comp14955_c0_seq1:1336-2892(-)
MSARAPESKRPKTAVPSMAMASSATAHLESEYDDDPFQSGSDTDGNDLSDDYFSDPEVGEAFSDVLRVTCKNAEDIEREMASANQKLQEISGFTRDQAAIVNSHYGWSLDQVLGLVCEDSSKVLIESHAAVKPSCQAAAAGATCCVCDDEEDILTPLDCQHAACESCWRQYIAGKIDAGFAHNITCIAYQCDLKVVPSLVQRLLPDRMPKYTNTLVEAYVDAQRQLKWCPTPSCETVVQKQFSEHTLHDNNVVCRTCEHPFCFDCGVFHLPASCKMVKEYDTMVAQDGDNISWLAANAKECPKCSAFIEKNGGCNWIKCGKCKYEFCWLCGRHMLHREVDAAGGNHKCNVFKEGEEEAIEKRDQARQSRKRQDTRHRFKHYYDRVKGHEESRTLESELKQQIPGPATIAQEQRRQLFRNVHAALSVLFEARSALRASYILAFYNKWPKHTHAEAIFQDLQHMLESRTEALSKSIEESCGLPVATPDSELVQAKDGILAKMDAVKHNLKSLIDSVHATD